MKSTFSRIAAPVLFGFTLALGACKQGDKPEDALAQDTSLAHDLQLANADTMKDYVQINREVFKSPTPPGRPNR